MKSTLKNPGTENAVAFIQCNIHFIRSLRQRLHTPDDSLLVLPSGAAMYSQGHGWWGVWGDSETGADVAEALLFLSWWENQRERERIREMRELIHQRSHLNAYRRQELNQILRPKVEQTLDSGIANHLVPPKVASNLEAFAASFNRKHHRNLNHGSAAAVQH